MKYKFYLRDTKSPRNCEKLPVPLVPIPVQYVKYEFCLGMKKTSLMRILMLCAGSSRRFSDGRLPVPLQENMENLNRNSLNNNNENDRYLFWFMIREVVT